MRPTPNHDSDRTKETYRYQILSTSVSSNLNNDDDEEDDDNTSEEAPNNMHQLYCQKDDEESINSCSSGSLPPQEFQVCEDEQINYQQLSDINNCATINNELDAQNCNASYKETYNSQKKASLANDLPSISSSSLFLSSAVPETNKNSHLLNLKLQTSTLSYIGNEIDFGLKCSVCEKYSRKFYCVKCVKAGNIIRPCINDVAETLADKRLKLLKLQDECKQICESYDKMMQSQFIQEDLTNQLRNLNKVVKNLKLLRNENKIKLSKTKNKLLESKLALENEQKSRISKENKIKLIGAIINEKTRIHTKRKNNEKQHINDVSEKARLRVYQLFNDVFQVEEFNLNDKNTSNSNMELSPLLALSSSSYQQIERQTAYTIVEPWLPSDGDYSEYSRWINDNPDFNIGSEDEIGRKNAAYRICAALGYTTQLVKNIAFYLDLVLPINMDLQVFTGVLLTNEQFAYNVAKLNSNIVYICISLDIDISLINPRKTLKNLSMILNPNVSDYNKWPKIELESPERIGKIERILRKDLSLIQEDYHDSSKFHTNDESSDSEWELSDHMNINITEYMQHQKLESDQQQHNSYIQMPMKFLSSIWNSNG